MAHSAKVRVMIVDDQQMMRERIETLLTHNAEFEVTGLAASGEEALLLAAYGKPDVVLIDMGMPGMGGLAAAKAMKESCPDTVILILTAFDDDANRIEALRSGASGYLPTNIGSEQLTEAIYEAWCGNLLLNGKIAPKPPQIATIGKSASKAQ